MIGGSSFLASNLEEITQTYWEISQEAAATQDECLRQTCIALLCTLGTACKFDRLRAAAARRAIDLMPQPGEN